MGRTRPHSRAALGCLGMHEINKTDVIAWLEKLAEIFEENRAYLTELDSPIGDADHGANMARGFNKVKEKLETIQDKSIDGLFKDVGMTLVSTVGGSSGPLYGTFFMKAATAAKGKETLDLPTLATMFEDALAGVVQRGKAELQDKTMIDALHPAVTAIKSAATDGTELIEALQQAVAAAEDGMKATIDMQARKGRASYLGERSIGHQDPGATSAYLILQAAHDTWKANDA